MSINSHFFDIFLFNFVLFGRKDNFYFQDAMDDDEILRRMQEKQKYGRRKSVSAEG